MRQKTEEQIQIKYVQWAALNVTNYPALSLLFAVPNGGSRNVIEAVNLKRSGTRKGVPDLFLPWASSGFHGLFIEMKSPTGRMSKEQKWWREKLIEAGYAHIVPRSFEEAKNMTLDYLKKVVA